MPSIMAMAVRNLPGKMMQRYVGGRSRAPPLQMFQRIING